MIVNQTTQNINVPSIQTGPTALVANPSRVAWNIQNVGMNPLYILLGSGASTTVYHVALKAGTSNDDGTGGTVGQEVGVIFSGAITVAGTSPRYVVLEQ